MTIREEITEILREADKFDHLIFCCDCEECKKDQKNALDQILKPIKARIEQIENPYPVEVFPEYGTSVDAKSGSLGRRVFRNTIKKVIELLEEE